MKLVIDRKNWARGVNSRLLSEDGKMCCLGFYMKSAGYSDEEILKVPAPCELQNIVNVPEWLLVEFVAGKIHNSDDASHLMGLNDATHNNENKREHLIAEEFAKHGVDVEFTG